MKRAFALLLLCGLQGAVSCVAFFREDPLIWVNTPSLPEKGGFATFKYHKDFDALELEEGGETYETPSVIQIEPEESLLFTSYDKNMKRVEEHQVECPVTFQPLIDSAYLLTSGPLGTIPYSISVVVDWLSGGFHGCEDVQLPQTEEEAAVCESVLVVFSPRVLREKRESLADTLLLELKKRLPFCFELDFSNPVAFEGTGELFVAHYINSQRLAVQSGTEWSQLPLVARKRVAHDFEANYVLKVDATSAQGTVKWTVVSLVEGRVLATDWTDFASESLLESSLAPKQAFTELLLLAPNSFSFRPVGGSPLGTSDDVKVFERLEPTTFRSTALSFGSIVHSDTVPEWSVQSYLSPRLHLRNNNFRFSPDAEAYTLETLAGVLDWNTGYYMPYGVLSASVGLGLGRVESRFSGSRRSYFGALGSLGVLFRSDISRFFFTEIFAETTIFPSNVQVFPGETARGVLVFGGGIGFHLGYGAASTLPSLFFD